MKEVDLGGEKSFIGAWYIPDLKVCDELIAYFKSSPAESSARQAMTGKSTKPSKTRSI